MSRVPVLCLQGLQEHFCRELCPLPQAQCLRHSPALELLGVLQGQGCCVSAAVSTQRYWDASVTVINPQSQRLLVKAVTCPGTELPKFFRGKKELVLKVLTAILHSCPSLEANRAGVCAVHWLLGTRGDSKVSCANSTGILWGGIMEGMCFSQLLISLCPASLC